MRVEPAHVEQIRAAASGRMVLIDADVGGVAADLKAIDPGLKVRFAEASGCFIVFHEEHGLDGRRSEHLVLSVKAHQTASGTWAGLDQRVVDRVREIDAQGRSDYDFASEVEKQNRAAHRAHKQQREERFSPAGERLAHALRKDRGVKSRAFIREASHAVE